ncbi:cytochrome P450 6g1-like isoform X1 [Culex pipiens pallens]|uniref:cytochrome P450 6g1-like isoform X1 n=1 Tax=Culex pipiens pallens TaxID=42434 RepID=UPI0019531C76|nr:cytochrome P450 6g1-like isoform X1 [Culex pipiens pallens]
MIYASWDVFSSYITLLLLCIVLFIAWFVSTGATRYWQCFEGLVPYIGGRPLVGNFLQPLLMRQSMFELMEQLYEDGRVKGSKLFGIALLMQPALVLRDPEVIKQVLIKDAAFFCNRFMCTDPASDPIGYYNLLMIKNPHWKQLRAFLTPSLSLAKIKKMYLLVDQIGQDMLSYVETLPEKRPQVREIELKELCAQFTTDVIASTFFGIRSCCLSQEESEFRYYGRKIFEYGARRGVTMASFFFMPELVPYLKFKLFPRDTEQFLRVIIQREMERREASGEKRGDFIDSLISLKSNDATIGVKEKIPLKDDILVAQAATFYMASFETTSSVLSFTLYELTKNPSIQQRLREEICAAIGRNQGSPELPYECIVNELPYLGAVISEAARLYPVLPFLERQCSLPEGATGYKLEPFHDFVIPNKMPVLIPIYAIHRDPKFFPDPLRFNPERFSKENLDKIVPCSYMPFGVGPRTCLGSHFGTLQVKVAIVRLLSRYRLMCSESTPKTLTYRKNAFTLCSNEGLFANLVEDKLF